MPRFIVIGSMSFSGSTMLCGLFNHVPNTAGVGEAHCILDGPWGFCNICKPPQDCSLMKKIRASRAQLKDGNLYLRLSQMLGVQNLVTSDKEPSHISRFAKRHQWSGVLLFKRPEALAYSNHRHQNVWGQQLDPGAFAAWNERLLQFMRSQSKDFVVVSYERFTAQPEAQMNAICKHLNLPAPKMPLVYPPQKEWHNIEGNIVSLVHEKQRYKQRSIVTDSRWVKGLPKDEIEAIQKHTKCQETYNKLMKLAI